MIYHFRMSLTYFKYVSHRYNLTNFLLAMNRVLSATKKNFIILVSKEIHFLVESFFPKGVVLVDPTL
jgi:hypothetical protein